MINKFEAVGIFVSIGLMVVALFLLRIENTTFVTQNIDTDTLSAAVSVVDESNSDQSQALFGALEESLNEEGLVSKLIIDDIIIGNGEAAEVGDAVTVHYVGTLQDGQQFDNSNVRGEPFSFTLGQDRVIEGWEEGVPGMKVGGERILVIPPEMAYGSQNVGPIPANSTLVFVISLLDIE